MSPEKSESQSNPGKAPKIACTACFDALWFCYSPVYQVQQYYRLGTLDNCTGKWSALVDCFLLKTKRASQIREIMEAREKANPQIWTLRTLDEASSYWKEYYGHLDKVQ